MIAQTIDAAIVIDAANEQDRIIQVRARGAAGEIHLRNSSIQPGRARIRIDMLAFGEDALADARDKRVDEEYDELRSAAIIQQAVIEGLNREIGSPVGPQARAVLKQERERAVQKYSSIRAKLTQLKPVRIAHGKSELMHFIDLMREEVFAHTPEMFETYMRKARRRREAEIMAAQHGGRS